NIFSEVLPVRVKIKKFFIIKTDQGFNVRYEPVCEENSQVTVEDLTHGGGLVQEQVLMSCMSDIRGESVQVTVSGLSYDSVYASFSDEKPQLIRNFLSHLSLQSSTRIFGLGDFNLGSTSAMPFKNWVSELSTDNAGGKVNLQSLNGSTVRQGFVASLRWGQASRLNIPE
ncbi:MAG: hypothetical protein KDD34_04225, partial [Bdellovibrionales bacterium]|nr:hypothetical protein [Bdellovibrionales bacterium]